MTSSPHSLAISSSSALSFVIYCLPNIFFLLSDNSLPAALRATACVSYEFLLLKRRTSPVDFIFRSRTYFLLLKALTWNYQNALQAPRIVLLSWLPLPECSIFLQRAAFLQNFVIFPCAYQLWNWRNASGFCYLYSNTRLFPMTHGSALQERLGFCRRGCAATAAGAFCRRDQTTGWELRRATIPAG